MAKVTKTSRTMLIQNELTGKRLDEIVKSAVDCDNEGVRTMSLKLLDCKKSDVVEKSSSFDFLNNSKVTINATAFGEIDLGGLMLLSSAKEGKRYASPNIKINMGIKNSLSKSKLEESEEKRFEHINNYALMLSRNSKTKPEMIMDMIKNDTIIDFKNGLAFGFFDESVKTKSKNPAAGNTNSVEATKIGILAEDVPVESNDAE